MHAIAAARALWRLLVRMDKPMLGLNLMLVTIGLLFVYGVGQEVGGEFANQWQRQLGNALVGLLVYLLCAAVDYRRLAEWSWLGYLIAIVVLALVLTPMGVVKNNSRSWLALPGLGVPLQPSELAKPAVLLFMAWLASHPLAKASRIHGAIPCLLALPAPLGLILKQPDFGTALAYVPFTLAIAFTARPRWRWIGLVAAAALACGVLAYRGLRPYQRDRIKVFLHAPSSLAVAEVSPLLPQSLREKAERWQAEVFGPSRDTWNARQSLLAVGSGGLWGKGFMKGTQHVLGFLPRNVASSDFVFSVIGEETGFIGAGGVVCAFIGILLCALRTAFTARDDLGCFIAVGVAVLLFTHVFINVGMTVKAAPIVGLPLPFVSHGGSFMLCTMVCAGLVQSVHIRHREGLR